MQLRTFPTVTKNVHHVAMVGIMRRKIVKDAKARGFLRNGGIVMFVTGALGTMNLCFAIIHTACMKILMQIGFAKIVI